MSAYPGGHVPDVLWDGIADPSLPAGTNPMQLCIKEPQASAVCDMHFDQLDIEQPQPVEDPRLRPDPVRLHAARRSRR